MKKSFKKEKYELLAEAIFDKNEIATASNKAAVRAAQDITVPGFRKGKAPIEKAMTHISSEKFNDFVINQLLRMIDKDFEQDKEFKKYLDEQKFSNERPDVHLESFTADEAKFHIHYPLNPEITKLGKYSGLKVSIEKDKVDDKKIENYIKDLAKQNAELVYKESEIKNGDTCNIDFVGYINGKEFDGGSAKAYDLEIGSKTFVPGFEEKLIGHKSGEKITVEVKLPDNYPEPLNGKDATFKVTINDVKEKKVPKINDDFATTLSGKFVSKNLTELKEKVKSELLKNADSKYESDVLSALVAQIKKDTSFEINPKIVEHNIEHRVANLENQAKAYGLTLDELLKIQNSTLDSVKADFKKQVQSEIENSLITDAIVTNEKIPLPNKDEINKTLGTSVDEYIKSSTEYYKKQGYSDAQINNQIQNYINNIATSIMQRRVNDKLLELNGYKKKEVKKETKEAKTDTPSKETKPKQTTKTSKK